ncbi:MAG TPA: FixH family protein [Pyrinomonadaceae bacterium]
MNFQRRLWPAVYNLLAFVLLLSLLAGCSRSSGAASQITVETEVTPQPAHVGPVTINFKLKDATGKPISGAHATLDGNMTHPGMAPALGEATEIAPGNYRGNLELSMGGDWVVMIHIALSDGQKFDRELELKGVRSD